MHKLLSIITGLFAKRGEGYQQDLEDEDQDEPLDLSQYGTPVEDFSIDHVTPS
jgi:hypothetical protein